MVNDHLQKDIYELLTADADLNTLLGGAGEAAKRVRWIHMLPQQGDMAPFVVFVRSGWNEDRSWKNFRHGTVLYKFYVYSRTHDSDVLRNILNRLHKVLDGAKRALSCASTSVAASMFVDGGPELYDEAAKAWLVDGTLELVVEFQDA